METDLPKVAHPASSISSETDNATQDTEAEIAEILNALPERKRTLLIRQFERHTHYEGPVMPPIMAEHYESLVPGAAERILVLAEKEQAHRHHQETTLLHHNYRHARTGLWCGFTAFILLIASAVLLAYGGMTGVAMALLAIGMAGVIGHFVNSHKQE